MKRNFTTIHMFAVGCLVIAAGCQTSPKNKAAFRMPGAPRTTAMPGTPNTTTMPGAPNTLSMPGVEGSPIPQTGLASEITNNQAAVARTPSGVVQASFTDRACGNGGCSHAACNSPGTSILPGGPILVGGPVRRIFGSAASAACGCKSCGDACTNEAAVPIEGYAEISPAGWNAFGVDPQEFICDGGDNEPRAFLNKEDRVVGLQPEDTVVHYTTDAGDIRIQPSNRTCLYSPRFSSIRQVTSAVAGARFVGLSTVDRPVGPERVDLQLPGLEMWDSASLAHADVAKRIDAIRDRNRGVPMEGDVAPFQQENVFQLLTALSALETGQLLDDQIALISEAALAAVTWTTDESLEVAIEDMKPPVLTRDQKIEAFTVYEFPEEGRLRIVKMADKQHAQSGEEVGFAIRVQNAGDSAVNNVVINDNLITRLVYVEDSQKTDRETEFNAIENTSRSHRLEWKLKEELKVGESLLIEFKCRVR